MGLAFFVPFVNAGHLIIKIKGDIVESIIDWGRLC